MQARVSAVDLAQALANLGVTDLAVTPLDDDVLWGRAIEDERYLIVAAAPDGQS